MINLVPDSRLIIPAEIRARIQTIRRAKYAYIDRPRRENYTTKRGDYEAKMKKIAAFDKRDAVLVSRLKAIGEPWQ